MSNIGIANSFFSHYASAATDNVAAYQGMHQYLDENVTFSDMAYHNIKGKRVFAMWHWFCTKKPEPVKVTFDPSKTREEDGIVILVYRAQYIFVDLFKKDKPIDYLITANLTIKDGKIIHHKDEADIKEWTEQAMGSLIAMIAWTPLFKRALSSKAEGLLDDFIKDNPTYKD